MDPIRCTVSGHLQMRHHCPRPETDAHSTPVIVRQFPVCRLVTVRRSGLGGDGVLATRDPRHPEGFGALEPPVTLHPGDRLTTTCTYDTTSREVSTHLPVGKHGRLASTVVEACTASRHGVVTTRVARLGRVRRSLLCAASLGESAGKGPALPCKLMLSLGQVPHGVRSVDVFLGRHIALKFSILK